MPRIDVQGFGLVDFPDSMTDSEIASAIETELAKTKPAAAADSKAKPATSSKIRNPELLGYDLPAEEEPAAKPVAKKPLSDEQRSKIEFATDEDFSNVTSPKGKLGTNIRDELSPMERENLVRLRQETKDPAAQAVFDEQLSRPDSVRKPVKLTAEEAAARAEDLSASQAEGRLTGPSIENIRGPEASFDSVSSGLINSLPQGIEVAKQGIRQQFADATGNEAMSADAQLQYGRAQNRIQDSTPEIDSPLFNAAYGGLASTMRMLPGLAGSVATRSAAPALAAAGLQTEAEAYTKYRARGASGLQAATGALGEGAIEVLTETMPMKFLVDKFGKEKSLSFVTGLLAREIAPEQAATLGQDAIDTAIANPDKTWGQYLAERPRAAFDTLIATVVQAGVVGAAHTAAHAAFQDARESANQQADAAISAISDATTVEEAVALATEAIQAPVDGPTLSQSLEPLNVSLPDSTTGVAAGAPIEGSDLSEGSSPDLTTGAGSGPLLTEALGDTSSPGGLNEQTDALGDSTLERPGDIAPGALQAKVDVGTGQIVSSSGAPYQTEKTALVQLRAKGLEGQYEVKQVDGGFALSKIQQQVAPATEAAVVPELEDPVLPATQTTVPSVESTDTSTEVPADAQTETTLPDVGAGSRYGDRLAEVNQEFADHADAIEQATGQRPPTLSSATPEQEAAFQPLSEAIGEAFGTEVIPFSDTDPLSPDGFEHRGTTFVNVGNLDNPAAFVAGHEFGHAMENSSDPEDVAVADWYKANLVPLISEEGKRQYAEKFLFAHRGKTLEDVMNDDGLRAELESEMAQDFMGKRLTDREFLNKLAERDPTGFTKFAQKWIGALDRMIQSLKGKRSLGHSDIDRHIQDLNRAKVIAQEALVRWRKNAKARESEATQDSESTVVNETEGTSTGGSDYIQFARKSRFANLKREKASGRYVGAPDWVGSSTEEVAKLYKKVRGLALEGESGRYWYEKSSKAVLDLVGGDKAEAEKFVGLLAIYSQGTEVGVNTGFALEAYYQWKAGLPIKTGRFPTEQTKKADKWLREGKDWGGIKTNNFYVDLMEEINPAHVDDSHATMDMWMALAFDYGMKVLDQGPKYTFANSMTELVAKDLGWKPHQVQAAVWTSIKTRIEATEKDRVAQERKNGIQSKNADGSWSYTKGREYDHFRLAHKLGMKLEITPDEIAAKGFDFSDALQQRMVQMSWEATPSVTAGTIPGIHQASYEHKREYLFDVAKALTEDGKNLIAEAVGLHNPPTLFGVSAWEGQIGAGAQSFFPAPITGTKKDRAVLPVARELLNDYSAMLGLVLRQDAVVWHTPVYDEAEARKNGSELVFNRALTPEEMNLLYLRVNDIFNTWEIAPGYTATGARLLNFVEGLDNKSFQKGIGALIESLPEDFGGGYVEDRGYRSDGEYIGNDWKENSNGETYQERLRARRPDILTTVAGLRARVEAVDRKYDEKYGWGSTSDVRQDSSRSDDQPPKIAFSRKENDTLGREQVLRDLYRLAENTYDESFSPDEAEAALLEAASAEQRAVLAALKRDDYLGFDYPHQAVAEMLDNPEAYEVSPSTKAALSKAGNVRFSRKALQPMSQLVLMNERMKAKSTWGKYLDKGHLAAVEDEDRAVGEKLNNLYMLAAQRKEDFDAFVTQLAEATGTEAKLAPLKKRERTMEKIMADYNGDVEDMKDVLRATIATESIAQARELYEALSASGKVADVKGALKSSLETGTGAGYRDAKVIVDVDGVPAELIIAPEALLQAKELAHSLYEQQRSLDAKRKTTASDKQAELYERQIEALDAKMIEIYLPASQRAQSSSAVLREHGSALSRRVSKLNGLLSGSNAKTLEPTLANGLPSKSKNSAESGNSASGDDIGSTSINDIIPEGNKISYSRKQIDMRVKDWAVSVKNRTSRTDGMVLVKSPSKDLNLAGVYRPIVLDLGHLRHVFNKHPEVTTDDIGALPDLLQRPRVAFSTADGPRVFIDSRDESGRPIAVALTNTKISNGKEVQKVTEVSTAFGKEDSAYYVVQELLRGNVSYMNEGEIDRLEGLKLATPEPSNVSGSSSLSPTAPTQDLKADPPTTPLADQSTVVSVPTGKGIVKLRVSAEALARAKGVNFSRKNPTAGSVFALPDETRGDVIAREWQNDQVRWKNQLELLREKGGVVNDQNDVYQAMERMTARAMNRTEDFYKDKVTPVLQRMKKLGVSMDEVGDYLYALHAKERNAAIKDINPQFANTTSADIGGSGMSDDEADQIVNATREKANFNDIEAIAKEFRAWAEANLDGLVQGGLLTRDQADSMRAKYPNYVPLKGFEGMDSDGPLGQGAGFSNAKDVVKRALGRGSRAGNPAVYIIHGVAESMLAREKANVGRYLERLVQDNPDDKLWTINKPEKDRLIGKAAGGVETVIERDMGYDPDAEVRFLRDGKQVRIQLKDPLLARAYNNRGSEEIGTILRASAGINSFLREMWTQKNPVFPFVNVIRDIPAGLLYATGEHGVTLAARLLRNSPAAWLAMWQQAAGKPVTNGMAKWVTEYRAAGGGIGFRMVGDIQSTMDKITRIEKQLGNKTIMQALAGGEIKEAGKRLLWKTYNNAVTDFIERVNIAFENMTRLAIYKAAREGGQSPSEASRLAKNATVNFNRKGEKTPNLSALYLFANASVQDLAKNKRTIADAAHKGQAHLILASVASLGFILAMMSGDDDELDEEGRNINNIRFKAGDSRVSIPLSYGLIGFMHYLGRSAALALKGEDVSVQSMRLASALITNVSPINPIPNPDKVDGKNAIVGMVPTALSFPAQVFLNRNSFGSDMRPDYNSNPDAYKAFRGTRGSVYADLAAYMNEHTGGTVRESGFIDVSPETLKGLMHFSLGGTGKFVADTASTTTDLLEGRDFNPNAMPLLNRFVKKEDESSYRSRFYRQAGEAKDKLELYNKYKDDGNSEKRKELAHWVILGRRGNKLWERMNMLRDRELRVERDDSLSAAEKDAKLQDLAAKQVEISERFHSLYKRKTAGS